MQRDPLLQPWQPPQPPRQVEQQDENTLTQVLCCPCRCFLEVPYYLVGDLCEVVGSMAGSVGSALSTGEERPTARLVIGTVQPPMQVRM